uniref:Uncharacterized protein n=1 Tax=Arundo donax TaxID=35708 RepID=A0A0A9DZW5_ARUDO
MDFSVFDIISFYIKMHKCVVKNVPNFFVSMFLQEQKGSRKIWI